MPTGNPLEPVNPTLETKLQHEDSEREMLIPTGIDYGSPKGYSPIARLVGVPCSVALKQVHSGYTPFRASWSPRTSGPKTSKDLIVAVSLDRGQSVIIQATTLSPPLTDVPGRGMTKRKACVGRRKHSL